MAITVWYVRTLGPEPTPTPFWLALLLALTFAVWVCLGVPWLMHLFPRNGMVTEKGIHVIHCDTGALVRCADIETCRLEDKLFDGRRLRVLVVNRRSGRAVEIALPPTVADETVDEALTRAGILLELHAARSTTVHASDATSEDP